MPTSTTAAAIPHPWNGVLPGLFYVLFFVASLALPGILGQNSGAPVVTPYSTDAEVARYLATTNHHLVPVAAFCQAMSALSPLAFVPFAPAYVRRIGAGDAYTGPIRAFGTVAAVFLLLSSSAQWVLNRPGTGDDLGVYRAVMDLVFITGAAAQVAPTGLLIGVFATADRKSRVLPGWPSWLNWLNWLNWLGLAVAALSALSTSRRSAT